MKAKNLFRLLPCVMLLIGGLSFASCNDDDNDGANGNADIDT